MNAELRHSFIELSRRRQRAGTGSLRDFLLRRTAKMRWIDLTCFLEPLPWAVVGAVATRLYMTERMTDDLDIVILPAHRLEVRRKLTAAGFQCQGELSVGGSSWIAPDGTVIDILEGGHDWLAAAIAEAQFNRDPQGLPILPLPYLVLMKFSAGRMQDLADITRMLGQASENSLEAVRVLLSRYSPADREDLESLIELGKLEIGLS